MRQLRITKSITSRESQSLVKYLNEISKAELLTTEQEVELAILVKKGDKKALDRLTKANLRFVVSVAKQYQGQGLSLEDLINEGNMGLIEAAGRFDETKGFKFISFAVWWIRQNILQALAHHSRMIRLPVNKVLLSNQVQRTRSLLEQQLERNPTDEELAEAMNVEVEEVSRSIMHSNRHTSLDTPLPGDEESSLIDTLKNHDATDTDKKVSYNESLRKEVSRSLQMLSPKQRQTICYFFGIGVDHPLGLDDIARKFDVTTERVRQIKEAALSKLRAMDNFDSLRDYLCA
ncbi:MAG TPA: sigma-70 family RNA polymerase sigma factor [Chitinophagaceae bacterium]